MKRPFVANYVQKLTHFDRQRYEDKIKLCGLDPYDLCEEDLSDDVSQWPKVTPVDRLDYFVYRTNFATKESMKAYKSLEAHNFFSSGLVFRPRVKQIPSERVIVLCKVHHSQRHSLEPLRCWILAEQGGEIVVGHCTCMAGRSETCSHVAAVVFMMEFAAKAEESVTCTGQLNAWLPPTMSSVPFKEVRDTDFRSSTARLRSLEAQIAGEDDPVPSRILPSVLKPTSEADKDFLANVAAANPTACVLSVVEEYCGPFVTPDDPPLVLTNLHDPSCSDLCLEDLRLKCRSILNDMTISQEQIDKIERETRRQADCLDWFAYRLGRITSSNMKRVCSGNPEKPAVSTINIICQQQKGLNTPDIQRGKRMEADARQMYEEVMKVEHRNLCVKLCGLCISASHPHIAASPDGIVKCDCCSGFGCLEVKCPRDENLCACFDDNGQLLKNHVYFFQVQTHMFTTGAKYCDVFCYTKSAGYKLTRVYPDKEFVDAMVQKASVYFENVILPELVSHHFSRNRTPLAPRSVNCDGVTVNVCYCQSPRRDPMVLCSGSKCTFREFHCRCVDLATTPKKKWFCGQCSHEAPKKRMKVKENILPF